MPLCRYCVSDLPFGAWWCPNCGRRSGYAPKGAAKRRPPDASSPDGEPAPPQSRDPDWEAGYRDGLRRRRRRRQVAAGIAGTLVALLAALLIGVIQGGPGSVVIPLTFDQKPFGDVFNPPPIVRVVIGKNQAVPLLVDTGSVGLRVFAGAISVAGSSDVTMSNRPEKVQTLDGTILSGTVASATLRLGNLATTRPVPFQVIDATSCGPNPLKVSCYRGGDQRTLGELGIDGIFGIGLDGPVPGSPVTNPLLSLPGKYGRIWTLDMTSAVGVGTGSLTLGPSPFEHPVARILLSSLGSWQAAPIWNDKPTLCWMIASRQLCRPTIFDSGATFSYIGSPSLYPQAIAPDPGLPHLLAANQAISISLPHDRAAFWSFDTSGPGSSAVAVADANWPFLDTGEEPFLSFEFQYDNRTGTIEIENPG